MNQILNLSRIKELLLLVKYLGTKFHCPICGYRSRALYPIGREIPVLREKLVIGAGLRNGGCYKCKSNDRERLVFTYLNEKLNVLKRKELKILHLAPERNIEKFLRRVGYIDYICGDLFTEGYQYPEDVVKMDVLSLPYEDNYFDLVICNHLLEHVPDDARAMKELFRVLNKGGKAIMQVPISKNSALTFEDSRVTEPRERERAFGQFDHCRIYGQDYSNKLESIGFKMERVNITAEFPKYGLNIEEDIYVGRKGLS